VPLDADVWQLEQFVLDEVLQLVAERALTLTGADGIAIAMAEGDAIVCRAIAGTIAPEPGARLDPKSGFSGACLRTGGIVRCDASENDSRVNVQVCRGLGTRSIVAVPIASAHGTIGLLEAFSAEPHGFNDSDVRSLKLLAELILSAMRPEKKTGWPKFRSGWWPGKRSRRRLAAFDIKKLVAPEEFFKAEETAGPESAPEIFQEYGKKQNFSGVLAVIVLLVALVLALGAGVWWKFRHSPTIKPEATATVAAPPAVAPTVEKQPEPAPPVPAAEDEAPSGPDEKQSGRTMVTAIWHVSPKDSNDNTSTLIIEMQGEVQYEAHRLRDPERIYFDLHNTHAGPGHVRQDH